MKWSKTYRFVWKPFMEKVGNALSGLLTFTKKSYEAALLLLIALLVCWGGVKAISIYHDNSYTITKFQVPEQIVKDGMTGEFLAKLYREDLLAMIQQSKSLETANISFSNDQGTSNFRIALFGISIESSLENLVNYVKPNKGNNQTIRCDIVDEGIALSLSIKIGDGAAIDLTEAKGQLSNELIIRLLMWRAAKLTQETLAPSSACAFNYNIGNYQYCIDFANEHLKFDSCNSSFYFLRGSAYEQLRQFENAVVDFDKVVDIVGYHENALLGLGHCHFHLNEIEASRKAFATVKESESSAASYYNGMGLCEADSNASKAIGYFKIALSKDSTFCSAYVNIASIFVDEGNYDSAAYYLDKAAFSDLTQCWEYVHIGRNIIQGGEGLPLGIPFPVDIQEKYPRNKYVYNYYANKLLEIYKFDSAKVLLKKALEIDENFIVGKINLAQLDFATGDYVEGNFIFQSLEPYYSADVLYERWGISLLMANNPGAAKEKFGKIGDGFNISIKAAIAYCNFATKDSMIADWGFDYCRIFFPENTRLLDWEIPCYLEHRNFEKAESAGHKLLELQPYDKFAIEAMASIYFKENKFYAAYNLYAKLIGMDSTNIMAYDRAAEALLELNKNEEAAALLQKSILLSSTNYLTLTFCARYLYEKKEYSNALSMANDAIRHIDQQVFALSTHDYTHTLYSRYQMALPYVYKAHCYFQLKQYSKAVADYKTALIIEPDNCQYLESWKRCLTKMQENPKDDIDFQKALKFSGCQNEMMFYYQ